MDDIERLECVYYPGQVPSNSAVLTVLCFLFDKIHFPHVYLPKGDYDKDLLRQEIARLEALNSERHQTGLLIGILKFLEYRLPLDGILEFPSTHQDILNAGKEAGNVAHALFFANFKPKNSTWQPMLDTASLDQRAARRR